MIVLKTTKHRYNDDEIKSVIQKTVRRADEEAALFFAFEMAHEGKSSFEVLRNHLKSIAFQDIGLANPERVLQVSQAVDDMNLLYDSNNEEWETSLAYIILLLCRSPKSRIADHFKVYIKSCWDDESGKFQVQIPDYALDYHTIRGNELGRTTYSENGVDHFIKAGEKLENESNEVKDIYKKKAHKVWREKIPRVREIVVP